ncbi:Holliday junction resolvase RuvX [Inhella gelatinilytica]|uniref:Putative pre-16S rRNA nuclease n=1 Tax=Inhella gelatinilytica TaxID=2795030 RepID=A0A931NB49_9BURK|nr:Holliday junction resolvase RuvX [Inhella gelatinilytica]MBH9553188.1 Holliday junction resolvase RuvX [Inhella gelatinilytica]
MSGPARGGLHPSEAQCPLAFDFGLKRVGVATGSRLTGQARALTTLRESGKAVFPAIERLLAEWQPDALVVGVPRHPDGQPHAMTAAAQKFAASLRGRFHKPVYEVDERYTSVEAAAQGARDLDAAAAALILEQFFRESSS